MNDQPSQLGVETIFKNEDEVFAEIERLNQRLMKKDGGTTKRAQHAKHHGLAKAEFTLRSDIPPAQRVGIFQEAKTYDALVRFSNGGESDDRKVDAHGMAIKLLDVAGAKLHPGGEESTDFDFVLIDHPVMFAANLTEYVAANELLADTQDRSVFGKLLEVADSVIDSRSVGLLGRLKKFKSQHQSTPLTSHYWSQTPYLLGEGQAVKYLARAGAFGKDRLRQALEQQLSGDQPTFTLGVHVQTDSETHPIEDATIPWWNELKDQGGIESMVPVADIKITGLHENSEDLAESLSFSPWSVTEHHRPLGAINRARKHLYAKLAAQRKSAS